MLSYHGDDLGDGVRVRPVEQAVALVGIALRLGHAFSLGPKQHRMPLCGVEFPEVLVLDPLDAGDTAEVGGGAVAEPRDRSGVSRSARIPRGCRAERQRASLRRRGARAQRSMARLHSRRWPRLPRPSRRRAGFISGGSACRGRRELLSGASFARPRARSSRGRGRSSRKKTTTTTTTATMRRKKR